MVLGVFVFVPDLVPADFDGDVLPLCGAEDLDADDFFWDVVFFADADELLLPADADFFLD